MLYPSIVNNNVSQNRTLNDKKRKAYPKGLCRWCGLDVKRFDSRKRTFCCEACVHEWLIRSDISYMRRQVFKRDKGICAECGLDTIQFVKNLKQACSGYYGTDRSYVEELFFQKYGLEPINFLRNGRDTLWEADHVVEVANPENPGGECGLENLQSLCIWCHKKKTAKFMKELAAYKAKLKT